MEIKALKLFAGACCCIALSACGGGGGGGDDETTNFTVSSSSNTGGNISPASANVQQGNSTSFTLVPEDGFSIESVSGCNGSLSGTTYTTGAVTANCTVTANFSQTVAVWDDPDATWDNIVWQ